MSRTFYPSDEYDSQELERAAVKRRLRQWLGRRSRHDDDDDGDPPMSPAGGRRPMPLPPHDAAALPA